MRRLIACGVMVLSVGAGVAAGQQGDEPALRGPKVRENRVPGADQGFSGDRRGDRMRPAPLPPGAFLAAIGKLRGEGAPEGLRLSEDQEQELKELTAEFRKQMQARERGAQDRAAEMREEGDAPRARRERAQQLAPQGVEFQTRAFAVLNQKQQEFVGGELAKARERLERERGEQMMERRLRDRAPGAASDRPGAAPGAPGERGAPAGRERLRRIAELLGQLPPEEREQFLSRIEAALEKRVGEQGAAPEEAPKPDRPAPRRPRRGGNPPR